MHSTSDVEINLPGTVAYPGTVGPSKEHLIVPVSWKLDPVTIIFVPPLTGPSLGFMSKIRGGL